jgi:hypothetical protein
MLTVDFLTPIGGNSAIAATLKVIHMFGIDKVVTFFTVNLVKNDLP